MSADRTGRALPVAVAWLIHPVTLGALVLLVVNDHLLKAAYPGVVTGKLSDVAGLVLLPPLLATVAAALARSLQTHLLAGAALLAAGTAYTLVKAFPAGAAAASALWSAVLGPSLIRADLTDLLALPALGLAGWTYRRARRRPASTLAVRRLGVLVVLPLGVLGVAATSQAEYPYAHSVAGWEGRLVVGQFGDDAPTADHGPTDWLVAYGDPPRWVPMTQAQRERFDADRSALVLDATKACVPGDLTRCYRLVPGRLRVEQSTDGGRSWRLSWEVPERQRGYQARSHPALEVPDRDLASRAVAVVAVPDGHQVAVANGRDGIAVRSADGRWSRLGFDGPGSFTQPVVSARFELGLLLPEATAAVLLGALVLAAIGWRVRHRNAPLVRFLRGGVAAGTGTTLLMLLVWATHQFELVFVVLVCWSAVAAAWAAALGLILLLDQVGGLRGPRILAALAAAPLAATITFLPFASWSTGLLSYRSAALIAVTVAVVSVVSAGRLGARWAAQA
ncbi:hypothetical protein [Micromonospora sp. NBC_01813]|uniref:hypothetical protein n=1 Tax=Micromonospora sp. NBC_01813 TaxID=2975988 RepID=UPI002DD98087|nr:hypothetical protein [Micromonospora sp. NBC_01813]WSA09182.1 hypothetical protein OG958_34410 [Micromonospora sp. NBC_01813]